MTELQQKEKANVTRSDTEQTRDVRQFVPDVDIWGTDEKLVLVADMPGVKPADLDVTLEKNTLTINGRTTTVDVGERTQDQVEYEPGDYHRAFTVSEEIDQKKIEASLKDGVLTLHLPKIKKARAKRIPISAK